MQHSKPTNNKPVSPYTDDDSALSNNLICPRYADSDSSSAPPSPASIESFDILDSVAWRRSHTSYSSQGKRVRASDILSLKWRKNKPEIMYIVLIFTLLLAGCFTGGYFVVKQEREAKIKDASSTGEVVNVVRRELGRIACGGMG
ncbi:hypothetical protein K469DRAFT_717313 [Zopfia rhizophila CBS 207.26]|uniref:Uncharacterized protein n=1 Tax=Zopfia rhizophila CBS 207.26 TaxID=1314779 RepID=A0A6A6EME1_9PEZI|nr:hypothetical protein K469DRAFT_717313 [Zopfia rhizophila CBS 207.26]